MGEVAAIPLLILRRSRGNEPIELFFGRVDLPNWTVSVLLHPVHGDIGDKHEPNSFALVYIDYSLGSIKVIKGRNDGRAGTGDTYTFTAA
jgi:hypothetical protein